MVIMETATAKLFTVLQPQNTCQQGEAISGGPEQRKRGVRWQADRRVSVWRIGGYRAYQLAGRFLMLMA